MHNARNYPDVRSELFFDPTGPHGVAHSKRVMILAETLAAIHGCTKREIVALRKASAYHDIGRVDNSADTKHGFASAQKVIYRGLLSNSSVDQDVISLIEQHCLADSRKDHILIRIFKDADALDRVRFGNQDCGLDVWYLRTGHAKQLVGFAHMLLRQIPEVPREIPKCSLDLNLNDG